MTDKPLTDDGYYFVCLGRQPGGYLDLLGLPPGASLPEASKAENTYRRNFENQAHKEKRELRQLKKAGELTGEEFEARSKDVDSALDDRLKLLNKLKGAFTAERSEALALRNKGIQIEIEVWLQMLPDLTELGTDGLVDRLISRPLPILDASFLTTPPPDPWTTLALMELGEAAPWEIEDFGGKAWGRFCKRLEQVQRQRRELLEEGLREGALSADEHANQQQKLREQEPAFKDAVARLNRICSQGLSQLRLTPPEKPNGQPPVPGLAQLTRMWDWRRASLLRWADTVWGRVRWTQREYWAEQIDDWVEEIQATRVGLRPLADWSAMRTSSLGHSEASQPCFPSLCRPPVRWMDELREEEITEPEPVTPDDSPAEPLDLHDLLAKLMAKGRQAEASPEPDEDEDPRAEVLRRLFEMLASEAREP